MVKLTHCSYQQRKSADALVVPCFEGKKAAEMAISDAALAKALAFPLKEGDFAGKLGETLLYYPKGEERVLLVGLGEKKALHSEAVLSAYAKARKAISFKSIKSANVCLVPGFERASVEGMLMAGYQFDKYKNKKAEKFLASMCLCGSVKAADLKKWEQLLEAVRLTQDLVNTSADEANVPGLIKVARDLAKKNSQLSLSVLDKKALVKEKMGLILAVGQGAAVDPSVVIFEYRGNPKSKESVAFVGKGVTFDTGGLNLKVGAAQLETMKCDMAGAAAVVGIMKACADLKLKVNVVGAIGLAENAIGPHSYKPGDVFYARNGKSVEVNNTDAEGRLVLADTICYVEDHYKCSSVIDMATLTGGVIIALGEETAGFFSNDDKLAAKLEKAAMRTDERLWRLPLYPEYREHINSQVADMQNSGGRKASAAMGAIFLKEFVKSASWAHVDIAGTAYLSQAKKPYHPSLATGYGVRLMIDFLENLKS